jgi:predicted RNA-binding Zn-ribbon protein involved in translation (DUF1610 family)
MTIRQIVNDLVSTGYTFYRIPPKELIRRSVSCEHQYQIHQCPNCSSVNVDIVPCGERFRGICYTCGFQTKPYTNALQAMEIWNNERTADDR